MPRSSPVIFWFLLAATLCVHAVSVSWIFVQEVSRSSEALPITFYIGLAFAELSVLSVWAVLLHDRISLRWLLPFLAGIAVACAVILKGSSRTDRIQLFFVYTGVMWTHNLFAMLMLWLLRPTTFLQGFAPLSNRRWQYGVAHLLVAMTALAVFLVVLQQAQTIVMELWNIVTMCLANTILLLIVLLAAQRVRHWPVRLAIALGAGLAVAAICSYTGLAFAKQLYSYAFNSIQAIVLWCWIEVLSAGHLSKPAPAEPLLQPAEQ